MDLLLINPGGRELIYQGLGAELSAVEPPLWCRLIAGYIADRGLSVQILDSEAENISPQRVAERVAALKPRLTGVITFGHQPSASTQQMAGARLICEAIKKLTPNQQIVMAGGHVAALPDRTLQEEAIDFACNGEGPITIHQLLLELLSDAAPDFSKVQGLVWRQDGQIMQSPAPPLIANLDADLHGNAWHLLPMEKYRAHNWQCFDDLSSRQPYASIYTTLGCPYRCSFCCINAPFGTNRYRMRSPESVVAEVDHLYNKYGVKTFKIIDEMFVLNDNHVKGICERLAAKPYAHELNFWAYARVDTVKPDHLKMIRSAGIRWLALGIESGSEHVRDGAEKSFDSQDIVDIVRAIQDAGIYVIGNYIFGLPDDNLKTMRETLDLAKLLNCEFANFYSAMAYPGSPLYRTAIENGWELPDSWSGFSQHSYNCKPLPTEHVSAAEVLRFRDDAFNEYFRNPGYLTMVREKFGEETRHHIDEMASRHLRRHLLGDPIAVPEPATASS